MQHVIHAVGPVFGSYPPEEADLLLASTYRSALAVAEGLGVERLAVPAISTGVYGFPERRAAAIAVREATAHEGAPDRDPPRGLRPGAADILTAALD